LGLKKGQTNNLNGRPRKNMSLTELLAKYGNKKVDFPENPEIHGMRLKDALTKKVWQLAVFNGDMTAIKYVFDRIDGKPAQTIITDLDRGNMPVFKALQKELFAEEELGGIQDEGTLGPPEEASPSVSE